MQPSYIILENMLKISEWTSNRNACTFLFIAASFTVANKQNCHSCPFIKGEYGKYSKCNYMQLWKYLISWYLQKMDKNAIIYIKSDRLRKTNIMFSHMWNLDLYLCICVYVSHETRKGIMIGDKQIYRKGKQRRQCY